METKESKKTSIIINTVAVLMENGRKWILIFSFFPFYIENVLLFIVVVCLVRVPSVFDNRFNVIKRIGIYENHASVQPIWLYNMCVLWYSRTCKTYTNGMKSKSVFISHMFDVIQNNGIESIHSIC